MGACTLYYCLILRQTPYVACMQTHATAHEANSKSSEHFACHCMTVLRTEYTPSLYSVLRTGTNSKQVIGKAGGHVIVVVRA